MTKEGDYQIDQRFQAAIERFKLKPADVMDTLGNPLWRIRNLYQIIDKAGRLVAFTPNWVQEQLLDDLFVKLIRRLAVLKSRKHGVSTLFEIVIFDLTYFGEMLQASILDLTAPNAEEKLKKIVKTAYQSLDADVRERADPNNNSSFGFPNGSIIYAGKQARGGQNQILHISEWGPIAHSDPKRSEEIKTGALPSADEGMVLIESTFKGGKGGDFYDLLKRAMETPEEHRTAKDYKFRFFAWWQDPRNTLEGEVRWLPRELKDYFAELERELAMVFSDGQKVWYWKTKLEQGIFMQREYPSTVEEAFRAPVEGAIYADAMQKLRAQKRITRYVTRDPGAPVFAAWDLGWNDSLSVWLFQLVGRDVIVFAEHTARHETGSEFMRWIEEQGVFVECHFLPHDGGSGNAASEGKSFEDVLAKAGANKVLIIPQVQNIWTGIDATRNLIGRCWFNAEGCDYGISALEAYHTKEATSNGVTSKEPVHDWSSHPSSALRVIAEGLEEGIIKPQLAKRVLTSMPPRMPDGTLVDLEHIRQKNPLLNRRGLAKSGLRAQR